MPAFNGNADILVCSVEKMLGAWDKNETGMGIGERTRPACPVWRLAERKGVKKRPARRQARQPRSFRTGNTRSPNCYRCYIPGPSVKCLRYEWVALS